MGLSPHHMTYRFFAGLLGGHSHFHISHCSIRCASFPQFFTETGSACGADFVVGIDAGTNDRRISDPAREFPGKAAGRRCCDEVGFAAGAVLEA